MIESDELIKLIELNGGLYKGASFVNSGNMFSPLGERAPYGECIWQASTAEYDLDDDLIEPSGAIYKGDIKKMPFLWVHDPSRVIGRGENLMKGRSADGVDALFLQLSYAPSAEAQEKRKLVEEGYVNAGSVRITPTKVKPNSRGGLHVTEYDLKEFSLHPLPRNTNTKLIYSKGGEYDDNIRNLLKSIRKQAIAKVVSALVNEYLESKRK